MVTVHNTGHPSCNVGHPRDCPAWVAETWYMAMPSADSSVSLSSLGIFVAMMNLEMTFNLCKLPYPYCFELPA